MSYLQSRGERGVAAVTVAVSLVALIMACGAAIDIGKAIYVRSSLQSTVDSAMKAASAAAITQSAAMTTADITTETKRITTEFIRSNDTLVGKIVNYDLGNSDDYIVKYVPSDPSAPDTNNEDTIAVTLNARVPNAFAKFFIPEIPIVINGLVKRPRPRPLDLVLALDVTNSMSQELAGGGGKTKLQLLKRSAIDLVQTLMKNSYVRVGIVPFTQYVNIGTGYVGKPWLDVKNSRKVCDPLVCKGGCKTEPATCQQADGITYPCKQKICTTDCSPGICRNTSFTGCVPARAKTTLGTFTINTDISNPTDPQYVGMTFTGDCQVDELTPLTASTDDDGKGLSDIRNAINKLDSVSLVSQGNTYIPNGLIWGWNMLDPNEPLTSPSAASGVTAPQKTLILITDGENFWTPTSGSGAGIAEHSQTTDSLTSLTCNNMKNATFPAGKMKIYVIALHIDDVATITMLQNCASPSEPERKYFFNVRRASDLQAAFAQIGIAFSYNTLKE